MTFSLAYAMPSTAATEKVVLGSVLDKFPLDPATPLKVLSIRQPWAWLILNAGKDIENRTWATKFRGTFLIHAGQQVERDAYLWVKNRFPKIEIPHPSEIGRGGIIGAVDLVDCFKPEQAHPNKQSPWYMGQTGFLLERPRPLVLIACSGKLGLFNADDTVEKRAREQLASLHGADPLSSAHLPSPLLLST